MSTGVKSYNVQELFEWLQNKPATGLLVDVREADELIEQGTIPGYDDNVPFFLSQTDPELFEMRFSSMNRCHQLVLSCRSGRRSLLASEYLISKLGFSNVYNVQGGILSWIESGYPVQKNSVGFLK
ncbi:putative Rhodanese domain protein [Choanephora cucurbitarum]|nr:putative Rhodanese domain protein [Choanephora cucurbitarum]